MIVNGDGLSRLCWRLDIRRVKSDLIETFKTTNGVYGIQKTTQTGFEIMP